MSSTETRKGVRIAAHAMFPDGSTLEWSSIGRKKLLRLVKEHKIRYLGTDNPQEILYAGESIGNFAKQLPVNCSFIHVNLTETGIAIPLMRLIKEYRLGDRKLGPMGTARALGQLIDQGVGMILEPFENETLIEIGRPRSAGHGGWSQARFERQGEEIIANAASVVRDHLQKHKIAFDEITYNTKYGAKQSRFHVFGSKKQVTAAIPRKSLFPAKVKVWSPTKRVITHRPLCNEFKKLQLPSHQVRRLILGLDPGMTTGVAIADLKGNVVRIFSRANLSKGELLSEVSEWGIPVLVCSDVDPCPNFVSKVASTFNAELSTPAAELSQADKRQLSKRFYDRKMDSHERDALSAVVYAYQRLEDKFNKLQPARLDARQEELARSLIIRGISIADSIAAARTLTKRKITQPDKEEVVQEKAEDPQAVISRLYNLLHEMTIYEETISNLRAHSGRLEMSLELVQARNKRLHHQLEKITNEETRNVLKDELVDSKSREIKHLKHKLQSMEAEQEDAKARIKGLEQMLWLSLEEEGLPIKVLPKFSHDAIDQLRTATGIEEGDLLLILDPSGGGLNTARNLSQHAIRMVFIEGADFAPEIASIFFTAGIPVLRAEGYGIRRQDLIAMINTDNFRHALDDYAAYQQTKLSEMKAHAIEKTIQNYQYERKKQIEVNAPNYDDYEGEEE